jgi:hypothetical protein
MYIEDGRERYTICERLESDDLEATHPEIGRRVSYCDLLNGVNKPYETYAISRAQNERARIYEYTM